jgi:hypothetical protein
VGALVRGSAALVLVPIFWLGTSGYRVRGRIEVDDEHVALLDPAGRRRWALPVKEVSRYASTSAEPQGD